MKFAFYHEEFDSDVSSGTIHAQYQWVELLLAFGLTEACVITQMKHNYNEISSDITIQTARDLKHFLEIAEGQVIGYIEQGGQNYQAFDYSRIDWLVTGGVDGLPRADIGLPTEGNRALYPREAAAIVLAEAIWQ